MIKQIISVERTEPVTLARAKEHFRVSHDDDDDYIREIIRAARERAETYTGRSFVTRSIRALFAEFDYEIELNPEPVQAVTLVEYRTSDDVWTTLASSNYSTELLPSLHFESQPDGIKTANGREPILRVTYTTGYSTTEPVPVVVKQAILMIARTLYDNREDVVKGMTINSIPTPALSLLNPYRIMKF